MPRSQRRGADHCGRYSRRVLLQRALLATAGIAALTLPAGAYDPTAQSPGGDDTKTLGDLLSTIAWDSASRGPLLVVGAETTPRLAADDGTPLLLLPEPAPDGRRNLSQTVPAFGRKLFPMGSLTVVAPEEMVVFDDSPATQPHVWATMNNSDRLTYLLSTLDTDQWARAGSPTGLGAQDLTTDDQRELFDALLPDPFGVDQVKLTEGGEEPLGSTTLNGDDRSRVRLRLQFSLALRISPQDQHGGYMLLYTGDQYGTPGTAVARLRRPPANRAYANGIAISDTVANRSKPADLRYTDPALAQPAALRDGETVRQLAERIGTAVGIELHADCRVASLTVSARGEQALAGDILQALALAVTGTWRRVQGNCFVLASDLEGAGTRKLTLVNRKWEADQLAAVALRSARRTIAKSGRIGTNVSSAPTDPLALFPDLDTAIRSAEPKGGQGLSLPVASLPKPLQDFLTPRFPTLDRAFPVDRQQVGPQRELSASFVLPDGTSVSAMRFGDIGDLGNVTFLQRVLPVSVDEDASKSAHAQQALTLGGPFPFAPQAKSRALFLAASSAEDARTAARTAGRYGFDTLYVVSGDATIIRAGVEEARGTKNPVAVRAVVSPFIAPSDASPDDLDRNLLGQTSDEILLARRASAAFQLYLNEDRRNGFGSIMTEWLTEPGVPSVTPTAVRTEPVSDIASIDGVAGIVLTCAEPAGYDGRMVEVVGEPPGPDIALGYASSLRLAFLRAAAVDPIDLIPPRMPFAADLFQPFFPDDDAQGSPPPMYPDYAAPSQEYRDKWRRWVEYRQDAHRRALASLYTAIRGRREDLPLYVAAQPAFGSWWASFSVVNPAFVPWSATGDVPVWSESLYDDPQSLLPIRISPPDKNDTGVSLGTMLRYLARPKATVTPGQFTRTGRLYSGRSPANDRALDLSSMPIVDAVRLLARWVVPRADS